MKNLGGKRPRNLDIYFPTDPCSKYGSRAAKLRAGIKRTMKRSRRSQELKNALVDTD